MAKKGNRVQVIMECTEHKTSGMAGTSRYITTKNKKNTPERLELKKFNPITSYYIVIIASVIATPSRLIRW
ncbi:MAG: 50S ribosomal protein L33 [Methanosarcinales archaeon]|nr:MAG: 50S ribosomal protein L33 [Methanosarcinales archaeon]